MGKEAFLIYTSFYKPISILSDKQLGRLFRAIFRYQLGEVVDVEDDIRMAFEFFKNQFEIDESKYQSKVKRDVENGHKGGNPNFKKGKANPYYNKDKKETIQDNPNITQDNRGLSNTTQDKAINDNDNDKETVSTNVEPVKKGTNVPKENHTPTPYENFQKWMRENTPSVLKLKNGITEEQYKKIRNDYSYEQLVSVLQSMENYKDLTKKYTSAYLTFLRWANRDYGDKT